MPVATTLDAGLRTSCGRTWMVLARLWRWLSRRPVSVAAKKEPVGDGSRSADARARFWIEFREGQREADAHAARLRRW